MVRDGTYRYVSFSDRISKISVSLLRARRSLATVPDEDHATFFYECLGKWEDLDCTREFGLFVSSLPRGISTFAELLHNKDIIIQSLKDALSVKSTPALPALLEFTVALARDLRDDFQPYFPEFFQLLLKVIGEAGADATILDQCFTTLSYLIKFMWKLLVKDPQGCFELFMPLLSHRKWYIRRFASEAFAFLVRKVKNLDEFVYFCFEKVQADPKLKEGLAELLFQSMKGVTHKLHSNAKEVLMSCLLVLQEKPIETEVAVDVLLLLGNKVMAATKPQYCGDYLQTYVDSFGQIISTVEEKQLLDASDSVVISSFCQVLTPWIDQQSGAFVNKHSVGVDRFSTVCQTLIECSDYTAEGIEFVEEVLLLTSSLLICKHDGLDRSQRLALVSAVFRSQAKNSAIFEFAERLYSLSSFDSDILPLFIEFLDRVNNEDDAMIRVDDILDRSLASLCKLVEIRSPLPADGGGIVEWKPLLLPKSSGDASDELMANDTLGATRTKIGAKVVEIVAAQWPYCPDMKNSDRHRQASPSSLSSEYRSLAALRLLPHFDGPDDVAVVDTALRVIEMTIDDLSQDTTKAGEKQRIAQESLRIAVMLLAINRPSALHAKFTMPTLLGLLAKPATDLSSCILRVVDYISAVVLTDPKPEGSSSALMPSENHLKMVYDLLGDCLMLPNHEMRSISTNILARFEGANDGNKASLFELMHQIENLPVDMASHRERLRLLRKLSWNEYQSLYLVSSQEVGMELAAIKYLIGCLYINFSLTWHPLQELIEGHIRNLGNDVLFPFVEQSLVIAQQNAKRQIFDMESDSSGPPDSHSKNSRDSSLIMFLSERLNPTVSPVDRPDHVNFRILMWKLLARVANVIEPRNRIFTPYVIRIVQNEFDRVDLTGATTQDLTAGNDPQHPDRRPCVLDTSVADSVAGVNGNASTAIAEETDGESSDEENRRSAVDKGIMESDSVAIDHKLQRSSVIKSLLAHLELYAAFHNPQALWRETEIKNIYKELLLCSNLSIQTATFRCLFAYRSAWLRPYQESIERLCNDKTFSEGLVLFSLDSDASIVEQKHRSQLLEVLLRFLYGRLRSKIGRHGSSTTHRQQILRFLAGCTAEELAIFLAFVFSPVRHLLKDDPIAMVKHIATGTDLTKTLPPKRLIGLLRTTSFIIEYLGHLIEASQSDIFKVLLACGATAVALRCRRGSIAGRYHTALKQLNQVVFARLKQFFGHFESYPYSGNELDALFIGILLPEAERLAGDGMNSPTGLLQLLVSWTTQPRLYPLFSLDPRHNPKDQPGATQEPPLLKEVFKLFKEPHLASSVKNAIFQLIFNLLTVGADAEDSAVERLPVLQGLDGYPVSHSMECSEIDRGIQLLIPYISDILCDISRRLQTLSARQTPSDRDVMILQRIAEYASGPSECSTLIRSLISLLRRGALKDDDGRTKIVVAVGRLMSCAEDPVQFQRDIAGLFSVLKGRDERNALCEVVEVSAARIPGLNSAAELAKQLNSWNPKRIEEPDYETRLIGLRSVNLVCQEAQAVSSYYLLYAAHNISHLITNVSDISLTDAASYSLQLLIENIHSMVDDNAGAELLRDLTNLTKTGLKSDIEAVRQEFLLILRKLVITYPKYSAFMGLIDLTNDDSEIDFFHNMNHIQLHRRARAIRRLNERLGQSISASSSDAVPVSGSAAVDTGCASVDLAMPSSVMVSFLMPIITPYLLESYYHKNTNLRDEAIGLIGTVANFLPWSRYYPLLQYYLGLLQRDRSRQKTIVRVVVAILDSFHFDVTDSQSSLASGNTKPSSDGNDIEDDHDDNADVSNKANDTNPELYGEQEDNEDRSDRAIEVNNKQHNQLKDKSKVFTTVTTRILPQLQKAITKKLAIDVVHRKSQGASTAMVEDVDSQALRGPIALALIKLLKKLPANLLSSNLSSVTMKVCHLLKSRSFDVRESTRKILVSILQTLGRSHLHLIISEMMYLLTRGYQKHVLSHTVFYLMDRLSADLQTGDVDTVVGNILKIVHEDLFGAVSEDKEVEEIKRHLPEARGTRSHQTFAILGRFVTEKSLCTIIASLSEWLDSQQKHKAVKSIGRLAHALSEGLVSNDAVTLENLLVILHRVIVENVVLDRCDQSQSSAVVEDVEAKPTKPDSYIIPMEPGRAGPPTVTIKRSSRHVMVSFAVSVLNGLLKKGKLSKEDSAHLGMLDPLVERLIKCTKSPEPKVICLALRCLIAMMPFQLPALSAAMKTLVEQIFVLLRSYCGLGQSIRGEGQDMLVILFKAIAKIIRDEKNGNNLNQHQLEVLIQYAEQDIYDSSRQATAFALLKALVHRNVECSEMHELMVKIRELIITSSAPHVSTQCQQIFLHYLLNYKLGRGIRKHIEFFLVQLEYEEESGRMAALSMLTSMISHFPQSILEKYATLHFYYLSMSLANDKSIKCKQMAAVVIKELLTKLAAKTRDDLWKAIVSGLKDNSQVAQRCLSARTIGIFADAESTAFERRVSGTLALLNDSLQYCFKKAEHKLEDSECSGIDQFVQQLLATLLKVLQRLPDLRRKSEIADELNPVWESVHQGLTYPHEAVRLQASRLFGFLFAAYDSSELKSSAGPDGTGHMGVISAEYLMKDLSVKVISLCEACLEQLRAPSIKDELIEQVLKNLIFLTKVISNRSDSCSTSPSSSPDVPKRTSIHPASSLEPSSALAPRPKLSLSWLAKEMARLARFEIVKFPKEVQKRKAVLKWIGAITIALPTELITLIMPDVLPIVHREMNVQDANEDLKALATQVADIIKDEVGMDTYTQANLKLHQSSASKREMRKRQRASEVITDPERSARRRLKKQRSKAEARKRKVLETTIGVMRKKRKIVT